jgi:hypothetical protein
MDFCIFHKYIYTILYFKNILDSRDYMIHLKQTFGNRLSDDLLHLTAIFGNVNYCNHNK